MARRNRYFGGLIGASPVVPYDEHWDDVTLLLDGSSTTNDISSNDQDTSLTFNGTAFSASTLTGPGSQGTRDVIDLNGTDQYITSSYYNSNLWNQDFTVEGWFYLDTNSGTQGFFAHRSSIAVKYGVQAYFSGGSNYGFVVGDGSNWLINTTGGTPSTGWHHIALTRNGNTFTLFVDGVSTATDSTSTAVVANGNFIIGNGESTSANQQFNGKFMDFRITEGIARYTSNFTPPTASFPTTANPIRPGVSNLGSLGGDNAFEAPSLDLNFDGQLSSFTRATISPTAAKTNGDQLATEIVSQNKTDLVQSMYVGPHGKLINGYVDNLVPHSTDFSTSAGWTHFGSLTITSGQADPFGGTAATILTDDDNAGYPNLQYTSFSGTSTSWCGSLFVKKATSNVANSLIRLSSATSGDRHDGQFNAYTGACQAFAYTGTTGDVAMTCDDFGDWWRFSLSVVHSTAKALAVFSVFPAVNSGSFNTSYDSGNATGSITVFGLQLETTATPSQYVSSTASPAQVPRVEYDASGNPLGLLSEESRTNLVPFSDFTNAAWTVGSAYTVSSASDSPSGSGDAAQINVAATGNLWLYDDVSATGLVGQTMTYSLFAKSTNSTLTVKLQMIGATNIPAAQLQVNPSTGGSASDTSTNITLSDYGSIDVGNGWHRYWISFVVPTGTTALRPNFVAAQGTTYVYGPQVEQGEGPTSYIPTDGASATRTADDITLATSDFGTNRAASTVFVDFSVGKTNVTYPGAFRIDDGSNTNNSTLYYDTTSSDLRYQNKENNVSTIWSIEANVPLPVSRAVAVRASGTEARPAIDGVLGSTKTLGAAPSTAFTTLQVGRTGVNRLNGHIRRFTYWPRAISDVSLVEYTGANPPTIDIDKPTRRWGGIIGRSLVETADENWNNVTLLLDGSGTTNDLSTQNVTVVNTDNLVSVVNGSDGGNITPHPYASSILKFPSSTLNDDNFVDLRPSNANGDFDFGTGDFTIEMWAYFLVVSNVPALWDTRTSSTGQSTADILLYVNGSGNLIYYSNAALITGSTAVTTSTWHHIALVRNGGTTALYLDGVSIGSTADSSSKVCMSAVAGGITNSRDRTAPVLGAVGVSSGSNNELDGYLVDVRITKGIARYTSNFNTDDVIANPAAWPTSVHTFPTTGRVTLLEHYQSKL